MRKALLDSENGAAAVATPGQLFAKWPDTCLLTSSWLGHVEIARALLDKGALVSTSDCDGRYNVIIITCDNRLLLFRIRQRLENYEYFNYDYHI